MFQDVTGVYNVTQLYTINERTSCTVSKLHVFCHDISEFFTFTCLDNQSTLTGEPFEYLLNQSQVKTKALVFVFYNRYASTGK